VFAPLQGVTFVDSAYEGSPLVQTCDPHPEPPTSWQDAYRELTLLPPHFDRMKGLGHLPRYSALHIRRTDLGPLSRQDNLYTPDEEFVAWCHSVPGPIYLATDNGTTQRHFGALIARMGKRVIVQGLIPEHPAQDEHERRNTDLATAAIDLFACARAARFKGTAASSFTGTIDVLRRIGGWWS
jgi:hypothetical protein